MKISDISRFNSKYKPNKNGCWIWMGHTSKQRRYGAINVNGKQEQAHRASWMIHNGEIPKGINVLHKCDTGECVNPSHLFLGTQYDNVMDMVKKGRHGGNYKLTKSQALEIRTSADNVKILSERYGISITEVYHIRSGRIWKRV